MQEKSFLATLFDFSFSSLITIKIVRFLYALALIGAAVWTLIVLVAAFNESGGAGIVVLVLTPIIFLLFAIVVRVYMELIIVQFKIADNTSKMAASMNASPTSPQAPPLPASASDE
jgi:uncharacterized membrane protein